MDISVFSLVAVCRACDALDYRPAARSSGKILRRREGRAGLQYDGVRKVALEHSVRYLAGTLASQNYVRVNAISAGPMRTLSSAGISHFDKMRQHSVKKSPLNREVEMEDLGNTGVYLLSHLSAGVTGEILHVDCGYNIIGL